MPDAEYRIGEHDILVIYGKERDLDRVQKL